MTPDEQARLDRLIARNRFLEAEYRRVCEELDWRDEKIRVLSRVIERLGGPNAEPLRQDHT